MGLRRDYTSVQFGRAFVPHFNHSVGAFVSSNREFNDALKARGDEHGTTYTRVDPGDAPTPSRDTEILESQARTIRDKGINPAELT